MITEAERRTEAVGWLYAALFAAALFGFPIVSVLPVALHSAPRPFSEAYRGVICLASVAALLLGRDRPKIDGTIRLCIVALVIMLLARMFWDSFITSLPLDLPWDDYWLQVIGMNLIPALAFFLVPESSWIRRAHYLALWLGVVAAAAIVFGAILSVKIFAQGGAAASGRLQTDVINPVSIGTAGVTIYIVASTFVMTRTVVMKIVRAVAIPSGIALCILSASKAPLLEFALVTVIQVLFPAGSMSIFRRVVRMLTLAMAVTTAAAVSLWASGSSGLVLVSRLLSAPGDESTNLRLAMGQSALEQFNRSPLVGDAFVESVLRTYPHNVFLESLMTVGVVGFFLLAYLVIVGSVNAFRHLRIPEFRWLGLLFLQVLISVQTSGSLYRGGTLWPVLLIVIAVARTPTLRNVLHQGLRPTRLGSQLLPDV